MPRKARKEAIRGERQPCLTWSPASVAVYGSAATAIRATEEERSHRRASAGIEIPARLAFSALQFSRIGRRPSPTSRRRLTPPVPGGNRTLRRRLGRPISPTIAGRRLVQADAAGTCWREAAQAAPDPRPFRCGERRICQKRRAQRMSRQTAPSQGTWQAIKAR
jgi:hypothetical protein